MTKRMTRVLALLLVVLLVLPNGVFAAEGEKTAAAGAAHIVSEPAGADVYIDGELYAPAVTPCDVPLSAGTHEISVRMSGFDDYDTTAKAGDSVSARLSATIPSGPNVRTIVVTIDDRMLDSRQMKWEYYERFVLNGEPEPEWSADWTDEDYMARYAYQSFQTGVSLRDAICIAENDTGWYDEENGVRWHYVIEFSDAQDTYWQSKDITCYGRGSGKYLSGESLFMNGSVEDTEAKALWSHDGCFTINGDRDRDGTPDVTLAGWEDWTWDGRWTLMLMCSDAHVIGVHFATTIHVSFAIPFWQPKNYFDIHDISICNCYFEGIRNGVGRFFGTSSAGIYGNGCNGHGQPGTYDLDGFTISGCTFQNDQLGIIVATGDMDYASLKNLVLQGNHIVNGSIFVRNVDAHTWYMWPGNPQMSGTMYGENCIGFCDHNTLEDVTISGNLVEFNADAIGGNVYNEGYGDVLQVGNSNLGGSHNTVRNVTVRCNRSTLEQANIDAYELWPDGGLRFENAAIGDDFDEAYDGALASSLCEVTDNLFDGLNVEYNDFELLHFDLTNISLVGTAQIGTDNYFRNIRFANNSFASVKGMKLTGANGNSNSGTVAEGELENVEVTDNTFTCLRKTGWGADSNLNDSGEQDDYGIRLVGANVADFRTSNWDESGEQTVWDGLKSTVTGVKIERNRIEGYANGVLVAGANCERTHYVTGIRVEDVTINDNVIVTDGVNKNCRNDGILLVGAFDGGTGCVIHHIEVSRNDVTATNGLLAAGFYFMGMRCRWGVSDNQALHITVTDNRFTYLDPRGVGGFPLAAADAVSSWREIPYALGKTAAVLTASGNTATGFAWKEMHLAKLSLRETDDEDAFLAKVQNACDAAIGYRYIDWSKDAVAEVCETPLFVGVCETPEYSPGNCHRWYLTPCSAGVTFGNENAVAPTCTAAGSYEEVARCSFCGEEMSREKKNGDPALGHNFGAWTVTKDPTCTAAGEETSTCSRCGEKETRPVDALGHDFGAWTVTKAPTCTAAGEETSQCSRCTEKKTRPVDALGHDWDDGVITLEPTETEKGEKTFTCRRCGATRTEEIPEKVHEHSYTAVVTPPTCTEQGYTTHTCVCGDSYVDSYVPALGHDLVTDPAIPATCTESGLTAGEHCTRCDYIVAQEVVAALGHNIVKDEAVAPTCTASGLTAGEHCTRCDYKVAQQTVPALGHTWNDGEITKPATETEDGVKTYTCTRCGATKTEVVPATGESACKHEHTHNEHKDATCTEAGYDKTVCDNCGKTVAEEIIAALGHNIVKDEAVAPTCTESGLTAGEHCTRCDYKVAQQTVPALGHAWDEGKVTTPATATKDGVKTYTCTRCGATKTEVIPATGEDQPCDGGENCPSRNFKDVNAGDWYHLAVDFAVERGLFKGMTETTFEPNTAMTRGMLVTVLWRYENSPKEGKNEFVDVKAGDWYEEAVAWAAEHGIVTGVGNGKFDPNGKITREQMAAILYRYSEYKEFDTSAKGDFGPFPDKDKVSTWAKDAYTWAVGAGLITGNVINGRTLLDPQGNATRAQVATILMRFIKNIVRPEITIVSN